MSDDYKQGYIDGINDLCKWLEENVGMITHYSHWHEENRLNKNYKEKINKSFENKLKL